MHYLNQVSGWLCLDKPEGISSNFAMVKVRRIFGEKTGYIGTLDPFATGVLPIAIGEARKFIQYTNESEKVYVFTIEFGKTTDTLDKYGKVINETSYIPSIQQLHNVLHEFVGKISQMPPAFSAIKINGVRACDMVRNGKEVNLNSRDVSIFSLKVIEDHLDRAQVTLEVSCSKGTYVRSLARDIAEKLNSLGYVTALRRTRSGFFSINNAISLENLSKIKDTKELIGVLSPLESPLDDIPALYLKEVDAIRLQRGLRVSVDDVGFSSSIVKVFDVENRRFYGLGRLSDHGELSAVRMCIDEINKGVKDVDSK